MGVWRPGLYATLSYQQGGSGGQSSSVFVLVIKEDCSLLFTMLFSQYTRGSTLVLNSSVILTHLATQQLQICSNVPL